MPAREDKCPSCGGTEFRTYTDNEGQTYDGCPNCVLVAEIPCRPMRGEFVSKCIVCGKPVKFYAYPSDEYPNCLIIDLDHARARMKQDGSEPLLEFICRDHPG